ncbi:LysM peptidoglycan-binding domain-containing protein [Phycisphaeraceae bacterium D3-23]
MNASYKIALVVAVGLLILVAGYYATRTSGTPQPVSDVSNATDASEVADANRDSTSADGRTTAPPQRPTGDRSAPDAAPPTTARDTGPAERPGRNPRTATALPNPPEIDPADAETDTPTVVDLGPEPAGLPRSLAEARNLGNTEASAPPPTRPAEAPEEAPVEEIVADAGPSETPDGTPIEGEQAPVAQPDTTTVEATPETQPQPEPAERPTFPARPAERAADTSGIPATYTITAGDMLVTIAERFYGTQTAWEAIAQANPTIDPTRLSIGDVLRMPRPDVVERPRTEPPAPTPGRRDAYTVQPGDNLYRIAQRFYNDAEKWDVIYNHNRDTIGDDPAKLREGMTLVIPPAVGGAE